MNQNRLGCFDANVPLSTAFLSTAAGVRIPSGWRAKEDAEFIRHYSYDINTFAHNVYAESSKSEESDMFRRRERRT